MGSNYIWFFLTAFFSEFIHVKKFLLHILFIHLPACGYFLQPLHCSKLGYYKHESVGERFLLILVDGEFFLC